jgi:hypothetical protein
MRIITKKWRFIIAALVAALLFVSGQGPSE